MIRSLDQVRADGHLFTEYYVTSRASQRTLAGSESVNIKIIVDHNIQEIVSLLGLHNTGKVGKLSILIIT